MVERAGVTDTPAKNAVRVLADEPSPPLLPGSGLAHPTLPLSTPFTRLQLAGPRHLRRRPRLTPRRRNAALVQRGGDAPRLVAASFSKDSTGRRYPRVVRRRIARANKPSHP